MHRVAAERMDTGDSLDTTAAGSESGVQTGDNGTPAPATPVVEKKGDPTSAIVAFRKENQALKTQLDEMNKRLEALTPKTDPDDGLDESERAKRARIRNDLREKELKPVEADRDKYRQALETERLANAKAAGESAATAANAVKPAHVLKLLDAEFKLNKDGQPVVLDADGEERYTGDRLMTYAERVSEFLQDAENAHLVKASVRDGASVSPGTPARSSSAGDTRARLQEAESRLVRAAPADRAKLQAEVSELKGQLQAEIMRRRR